MTGRWSFGHGARGGTTLPLRWAMLPLFRTWVAGRAIDLDDARGLLSGQDLEDGRVSRIEGTPALILRGRRSNDA